MQCAQWFFSTARALIVIKFQWIHPYTPHCSNILLRSSIQYLCYSCLLREEERSTKMCFAISIASNIDLDTSWTRFLAAPEAQELPKSVLEAMLGPPWGLLGPSWGLLENLGPSWDRLGANSGPSWVLLGPSWGLLGAFSGPSWGILACVGNIWHG